MLGINGRVSAVPDLQTNPVLLWNKAFLDELEAFPKGAHDDQVDGLSGGFNFLESHNVQPSAGATVEAPKDTYDPQSIAERQRRGLLQNRAYRPFFRRG